MGSLPEALAVLYQKKDLGEIFVIGGHSLYLECLTTCKENCKLIIGTRINAEFKEADVFMPAIDSAEWAPLFVSETQSEKGLTFDFLIHGNRSLMRTEPEKVAPTRLMEWYKPHAEMQYLNCIREIIATGV